MTSKTAINFERIRERAYELWDRNHRPYGLDIEFRFLAERELRTQAATSDEAANGFDAGPDHERADEDRS